MANSTVQAVEQNRALAISRQVLLVVGASLFMALCGRLSMPLPFTPVPLTVANFGVLFIALTLGSRRGAAALLLYLAQGAMGLPVFSPAGQGGITQLLGPTGGFLMAYPVVAFVTGWIAEQGKSNVLRYTLAAIIGEVLLFIGGIGWLIVAWHASFSQATNWGIYPFVPAEIIKVMSAVGASLRLHRSNRLTGLFS
jgi:biotin transport system substrate-specific component